MTSASIALGGDAMLGRQVGDLLASRPDAPLFDAAVLEQLQGAELSLVNLECCISQRGERWPDPRKPFFFRAPPVAAHVLRDAGVDVVTLANNHALDHGYVALEDTLQHLAVAGIRSVGAGRDVDEARAPIVVDVAGRRIGIIAGSDHPDDFAAGPATPGIALWAPADDTWLPDAVERLAERTDMVVVTVHWGPNMVTEPSDRIITGAQRLVGAGATLVVGHSAHVFHGVEWIAADGGHSPVLYDLGDLLDDYAVDPVLRNDLGLFWVARLEGTEITAIDALPLHLDHGHTRRADAPDEDWIAARLGTACAAFGTPTSRRDGRFVVHPRPDAGER